MFYSDDPVADFLRHDAECDREMDRLPRCSYCNEPIQEDFCYEINDELICEDCLVSNHRRTVDDYCE